MVWYGISAASAMGQQIPEPLKPLQTLVGDWIALSTDASGANSVRRISYRWTEDRRSLSAHSSRVQGTTKVEMTVLYSWHVPSQTVRATTTGSDGTHLEAYVDASDKVIRLHSKGTLANGISASMDSLLEEIGPDSRLETWVDIRFGGVKQPGPPPTIHWLRDTSSIR
jgi:hypothetical protein